MLAQDPFACPYCDAVLNGGALSCRCCGRDLTPVLPLLRRISTLEARLVTLEETAEQARLALPPPAPAPVEAPARLPVETQAESPSPTGRRRFRALLVGFVALLAGYWTVVFWLDLSLAVLRLVSIIVPFITGVAYFGIRPRLTWFDTSVAILFALLSVATMNAILGWIDDVPIAPQGAAAWRETFFYALSIGASMFSGMLLRMSQAALSARGLMSLPRLRESILATNGKVPMDALKAIELTILMVGSAISAITGLVAGFIGVAR